MSETECAIMHVIQSTFQTKMRKSEFHVVSMLRDFDNQREESPSMEEKTMQSYSMADLGDGTLLDKFCARPCSICPC